MKYKYHFGIVNLLLFILSISFITCSTGCKKLIEVNTPTTSIDAKNVYTNDATAASVITGIYTKISSSTIPNTDLTSIGFMTGLSGDELTLYPTSSNIRLKSYYQNNLKNITKNPDFWTTIYSEIYITNLAIEGIEKSTSLNPIIKKQLVGEARFMRAFCYFYLINLYGDVPLITSTLYAANNISTRTSQKDVWTQIISDLQSSKLLLSEGYLDGSLLSPTMERVRPTKWAATALLARSYLYTKDWKNAEIQATEIINNTLLYNLDSAENVFLMNSREAIWQLQPVNNSSNTEDAKIYIIPSKGPSSLNPVYLSSEFLERFENGDHRKKVWIDTVSSRGILYYYAYKYKNGKIGDPLVEYNTVFRLGEQYLIRAEARAQQNDILNSRNDLNSIRRRAWLPDSKLVEKNDLLSAIYQEREAELFTEWGHRWFDLKRTQRINSIMANVTPLKGGSWSPDWQLFPIPSYDITSNSNLTQNAGY